MATRSSGTLQYVRVWNGGAIVGANNNERVTASPSAASAPAPMSTTARWRSTRTTASSTVNLKYLSALFVCDESFAAAEPATAQHADLASSLTLASSLALSLATHSDSPVIAAVVAATVAAALAAAALAPTSLAATSTATSTATS